MFELLIYTDCSAEESVNGRTGFQFQAESVGATPSDEAVVLSDLQHVVESDLAVDEPQSHPPSCTYTAQRGRFYLARGVSTGKTLSGRPGNQLTETIVTGDTADILPLRPAQLYAAANWTLRRAPAKVVPGWQAPLEISPDFEVAALHSFITSDPWALSVLPSFLTMVEQAMGSPRTKLIIKHPDQKTIMKWVSLSQLVMDADAALQSSFRIFSSNPVADSADIVGAHPQLSPEISATSTGGQNVLDLIDRVGTNVTVTKSAHRHARWFAGADPYGALDAIEVSRRWAVVMDPDTASAAAEIACLGFSGAPERAQYLVTARALDALATRKQSDELEAYGESLVDLLADYLTGSSSDFEPAVTALWALNAAAESTLVSHIALAMLERASASPGYAQEWAALHIELPASDGLMMEWRDDEARKYADSLATSILQRGSLDALPALFSLVKSLNVQGVASDVDSRITELALHWVFHPELTTRAYTWVHREFVIYEMMRHLGEQLSLQKPRLIESLDRGNWDWLLGEQWSFDASDPTAIWLAARDLAKASREDRRLKFEIYSPHAPVWAWSLFITRGGPDEHNELAQWVRDHPSLDESLSRHIDQQIRSDLASGPTSKTALLLSQISDQAVFGHTPELKELKQNHFYLESQWRTAVHDIAEPVNLALRQLRDCPREWLQMHRDPLITCVLEAEDRAAAVALAKAGLIGTDLGNVIESRLAQGEVGALIGALNLMSDGDAELKNSAKRAMDAVWDERGSQVTDVLKGNLPLAWAPLLDAYEQAQTRGRLGRELSRGARSLFGRKD